MVTGDVGRWRYPAVRRPSYGGVHMLELEVVRVLRAVLSVQGNKVAIFRESVPEELIPRYEKASSSDEQEDLESSDG
jgi:hypothetical protein